MKIQCGVCEKQEASVFCAADEAALCDGCDYRVHHANKLASKHQRFVLRHPSFKEGPICDICKARRAFLFCKEDRAILCRECDTSIHKANEHTQKHNRFLLTGLRISPSSITYPNSSSPLSTSSSKPKSENRNSVTMSGYDQNMPSNNLYYSHMSNNTTSSANDYNQINEDCSISTENSIPEYLMDDVPGWRLEDLLDSSYAPYCKTFDNTNSLNLANPNKQVEEESTGAFSSTEEYSRMWEYHQGPVVPTQFSPIFHDRL